MKVSDSHIKYAKAIFNLAVRLGVEENVLEQLSGLGELYNDEKFCALIKSFTFMDTASGQKVLQEVFGKKMEKIVFNLLITLFLNRKLLLIPRINQVYRKIYHQKKGIADITLVTARQLSKDEKLLMEKTISAKKTKKISLKYEVNPVLVGGVQYYEEGYMTDLSIQNYLQTLKKHLISKEIN
ncbi:MAG: ATP synthase F1 subunit delta [Patescibacteria group bacterium]